MNASAPGVARESLVDKGEESAPLVIVSAELENSDVTVTSGAAPEEEPGNGDCSGGTGQAGDQEAEFKAVGLATTSPDDNRLIVSATVNGSATLALIDTGATHSMISESWLRMHNIMVQPSDCRVLHGFGLGNLVEVTGCVHLELMISGLVMKPFKFQVVRVEQSSDVPLIIAEDFLRTHGISVDLKWRRLQLSGATGGTIDIYYDKNNLHNRTIYNNMACMVSDTTKIFRDDLVKVPVHVCAGKSCVGLTSDVDIQPCVFEPEEELKGVYVLPGILAEPRCSILACAKGDISRSVEHGTIIGRIFTIVSETEATLRGEVMTSSEPAVVKGETGSKPILELIELTDYLSLEEKTRVLELLNKHAEVFSKDESDIGRLDVLEYHIELLDSTPIYLKPRQFPEPVASDIAERCEQLQLLDIIEPSMSSWSSPVVPVRKKDGTMRLCVDYRRLNSVTKPDRYPLPNLNDSVYSLFGMRYFTSLDVTRGFYHVPIDKSSRECTAFSTQSGHWQFKRMPFGLRNAPAAFQRAMQLVLHKFPRGNVIVYIDDVLIMSATFEEQLLMVGKVLNTLKEHGIKLKLEKCTWFKEEVEYLGHLVGASGMRKVPAYVDKVRNMDKPKTVGQLREFLGLANFQRKFVANFSSIQKPLSEKTSGRKGKVLQWTQEMIHAFEDLKSRICNDVHLSFPDFSAGAAPLELYVDASAVGAGACLAQQQGSEVHIIAYASTTFAESERHYSTIERELAALRWGVKSLRPFLIGSEFIIHTDHQPLIYLNNMKIIDSRLARTLEDLSDYNFVIQYTPGKCNSAADALSRLYEPGSVLHDCEAIVPGRLPAGLIVTEKVPGGGDSLFQSLHHLTLTSNLSRAPCVSSLQLRELLVDDILKRPHTYKMTLTRNTRKQLKLMRCEGQLPCAEVMYAFGELFGCIVMVHFSESCTINFISPSHLATEPLNRVHLQCLSGVHYNPVAALEGYRPDPVAVTCGLPTITPVEEPCDGADTMSDTDVDEGLLVAFTTEASDVTESWCLKHGRSHLASLMVFLPSGACCALLDSGSQISCITESIVKEHSLMVDHDVKYSIVGLGAKRSTVVGMTTCSVAFPKGNVMQLVAAVVPDCSMPYCVILGVDFLLANGISVDLSSYQCRQGDSVVAGLPNLGVAAGNSAGQITIMTCSLLGDESGMLNSDPDPCFSLISRDTVHKLQQRSSVVKRVKAQLKIDPKQRWPTAINNYRRFRDLLLVKEGILFYSEGFILVPVVTFQVLVELVITIHVQLAHIGRQKLIERVKQHVWNPSLSKVAGDVTATCDLCQHMKVAPLAVPPIHKVQTSGPFELVTVDLVSLPKSGCYLACLVVVDHHSKWLSAVPLTSKTAGAVGSAFATRVIPCLPRCPDRLLSDNGPEFVGVAFNEVLTEFGVLHCYTTPNRPPSNGLAERTIRTLVEILRLQTGTKDCSGWSNYLPKVTLIYNHNFHSALGMSPSEFLLQKQHLSPVPPLVPGEVTEKWKEGNPSFGSYTCGQKVLKKIILKGNLVSNKFCDRFQGPFEVVQVNQNGVTYLIRDCATGEIIRAHHGQLRKYLEPPKYLVDHPAYPSLLKDEADSDVSSAGEASFPGCYLGYTSSEDLSEDSFAGFMDAECCAVETQKPVLSARERQVCPDDGDVVQDRGLAHLPEADNPLLLQYPMESTDVEGVCLGDQSFVTLDEWVASAATGYLPLEEENHVGISLQQSQVFWDVSVGNSPGDPDSLDTPRGSAVPSNNCNQEKLVGSAVGSLQLESDSFSGFDSDSLDNQSLSRHLQRIQEMVQDLKHRMSRVWVHPSVSRVRDSRAVACTSTMQTRSRGVVAALPNVQASTLEYKRRQPVRGKHVKVD